jgi:predicted RND superfamily exporter protein
MTEHQNPEPDLKDSKEQESQLIAETPNPFFLALGKWILKFQWFIILLILLITGASAWQIKNHLKVDNSLEVFAPQNAPVMTFLDRYRDLFGRDDYFMISVEGDILKAQTIEKLRKLHTELEGLKLKVDTLGQRRNKKTQATQAQSKSDDFGANDDFGSNDADWGDATDQVVEEVTSLINIRRTYAQDGNLRVEKWLDGIDEQAEIDQIKTQLVNDPLIKNRLIDTNGTITILMVKIDFMSEDDTAKVYRALDTLVKPYQQDGFKVSVTGAPAINASLNEVVLLDLKTLVVYSALMMLFVLIYIFRRPLMVIGPMMIVTLSVIWTLGLMATLGLGLNLLSSILPAFLLCVGLGDSIHVQSIYLGLRREGVDNRSAVELSCGLTGIPVLFTSLTTMIGLFSFETATVGAIKEMGIAGGAGVFFALLLSLLLLPLFLNLQNPSIDKIQENQGSRIIDQILSSFVGLSQKRFGRNLVILISLILTGLAVFGVTQISVRHDDLENLPPNHPIKKPILKLDTTLGGAAAAEYLVAFNPDGKSKDDQSLGLKKVEYLQKIDALVQRALAYRNPQGEQIVGNAVAITNIVKETKKALMDGDESMPTKQDEASQLLNLFELQSPSELKKIATIDSFITHISLQMKWKEATSYKHFIQSMDQAIEEIFKQELEVKATGGIYLAYTIVSSLLSDLIQSFGSAFLIICILMIFMLKDVKLGLLSMIPNLFPILLMLGFLGLMDIPLDLNNLLIASIALGIVVDDTIHFLHHFQMGYQLNNDCEQALENALKHAGRAMLSTTILLGAGFIVYLMASTTAIGRFGVIIASTIAVAFLADLIICPAVLRIAYGKRK